MVVSLIYTHLKRRHKMSKLLKGIIEFLTPRPQSGIEAFIASKNPKSVAEIEFWARVYDQNKGFVWGRGL
jgi:hypothetical protein